MLIWLINPYGSIPGESWRDYSFTMMADALVGAGHQVIWWTSTFSHHFKKQRAEKWTDLQIKPGFKVRLVPSPSYKKNIGFGRIIRDFIFARNTYRRGCNEDRPDTIIYYESPLNFGYAGYKLSKFHNCPVIFHVFDLWPELMVKAFPRIVQPFLNVIFTPVLVARKQIYRNLDCITALAKYYLESPLQEAPILRQKPHTIIYNGIDINKFRGFMGNDINDINLKSLVEKRTGEIWAIFAGSLGPSYDILCILEAAKRIQDSQLPIKILIAGDGPLRHVVEEACEESTCKCLSYVGSLTPENLAVLYGQCQIGLCAYSSRSNVEMPDKFYDYTAAGLAIVNSLKGEVSEVIHDQKVGLQYEAGNVADLYGKLKKLAEQPQLITEFAKNSMRIGEEYDQHKQYAKIVPIVEEVYRVHATTSH